MNRHEMVGRSSLLALTVSALIGLPAGHAAAQSISDVVVTAQKQSTPSEAPTHTPLDVVEPTSVLTQQYIQNNVPVAANYDEVISITPSVNSVSPNGPGLMEDGVTIRGFQDGQYNVTIDGIAWGDSNDFTHHTTSYMMSHDMGAVVVDRGPGTASTLGDATFGGTISMLTKDPLDRQTIEGYASAGSFGTYLGGAEIDTGKLSDLGGAKGLLDVEHLESNGALSYMGQNRTNIFAKIEAPLNDRTTVTVVAMFNHVHQNISLGTTEAEMASNGYMYGLNNNPASQAYYGYNYDQIKTELSYIGVKSDLGNGFLLDNKAYTYAYWHHGFNGEDPNGETPNGTIYSATDVPGEEMRNSYVSIGDILRLSKDFGIVTAKTGFWFDHQIDHRSLWEIDDTLGGAQNVFPAPPQTGGVTIDREQDNTLDTFQPYLQADIKPLPGLTLSPGVKWDYFRRSTDAVVQQNTLVPFNYEKAWSTIAPSFDANYKVTQNISVYAQVAKGFLAPNLNVFYTTNPSLSSTLKPQTTWNYQAGATFSSSRLTVSGDVYYIDFGNEIVKGPTVGGVTTFVNAGGVIYKGIEGDATFRLVDGFSLYANGSLNSAKDKTQQFTIPNSPKSTAAGGLIYDDHHIYAAVLAKYIGSFYGDTNPLIPTLGNYATAQMSLGYTFDRTDSHPAIKIKGIIDNLFDKQGHSALAGYTVQDSTPLYWNIVPRSYTVEMSVAF